MDDRRRAAHALGRAETRHAPDDRVAAFEPALSVEDGTLVLGGTVSTDHLREHARAAVEGAVDLPVRDEVTVLDAGAAERTVTRPRVAARGRPDADGERVTELRYGQAVAALDAEGDWRRARCPDGYLAWVPAAALAAPADVSPDALVTATRVEGGPVDPLYAGTPCERAGSDGDAVTVRFRTGASATLPADAVGAPPGTPTGEDVVRVAEQFLGTDYRWGGMTVDGIDCSGLAWVAYRGNGVVLPRDADQQRAMGDPVDRDALEPGDLLFFPGHVAVSTGGAGVVHAERDSGGVVHASLDPGAAAEGAHDTGYSERLDDEFECARRLL